MELKGCCFKHTAANEQYMCDHIASVLGSEGIATGNKPLAIWKYSIPEEPIPQVNRDREGGDSGSGYVRGVHSH